MRMSCFVVLLFMLVMSITMVAQLTTFSYHVINHTTNPDTTGYGTIVGTDPRDPTTTTISTIVVPIVLNILQGGTLYTFDPTAPDLGCLNTATTPLDLLKQSPLFQPVPNLPINGFNEGTVQYLDAIQRAEFPAFVDINHHTELSNPPAVGSTLTIPINADQFGNATAKVFPSESGCDVINGINGVPQAVVDMDTIKTNAEAWIRKNSNTLDASQLPVFVMYNTSMAHGIASPGTCGRPTTSGCDLKGLHNALGMPTPTNPGQTYVIAGFQGNANEFTDFKDISAISTEIIEWANNPSTMNTQTPAWGIIGEQNGCVTNTFEVGQPLAGTLAASITGVNGFTYNFQEVAFFSWFYRDPLHPGAGGKFFSSNRSFTGCSKVCPPGGTN